MPIMVQDAPLSGSRAFAPFVRPAREVPRSVLQDRDARHRGASCRALIEAGGEAIAGPFDGEESITLDGGPRRRRHRHDACALLPDCIKPVRRR
jgi:hypothetical protein